jgi:starch synthase (maltosyl-transferring)
MPIGFEFGFRKRLHVVKTRPSDWEESQVDLTGFIREVNRIKRICPVFNEDGPIEVLDVGNKKVLCLQKKTFSGDECALILLNKDRKSSRQYKISSFPSIFPSVSLVKDISPEPARSSGRDKSSGELGPSGYRVFYLTGHS